MGGGGMGGGQMMGDVASPTMMPGQGGVPFSLVPLVWESSPKLQGGWCKPSTSLVVGVKAGLQEAHHQRRFSGEEAYTIRFVLL